jgi:tetratricopeptide (TPR) repeat protein
MSKLKSFLLLACCTVAMSGCLYNQKKMVDPAAPVTVNTADGDKPGGPVQESDPRRQEIASLGRSDIAAQGGGRFTPSVEYVTGRIAEYNKKMERWRERDSQAAVLRIPADESEKMVGCFRDLQKVLNGYNRLHETILQQAAMPNGTKSGVNGSVSIKEMYELQQSDIAFVDGFCGQAVAIDSTKGSGWLKNNETGTLSPGEAMIAQHAANGEFEELVQVWKMMPGAAAARASLHSKVLYGKALMALKQEDEAANVFRQMVDQMTPTGNQPVELLALRKTLADLYLASGNYAEAESQYLEISKGYKDMASIDDWAILQRSILKRGEQGGAELTDYSDLLKNYLGFNPAKDGYTVVWQADKFLQTYPYSPVALNVDIIRTAAREQADKWAQKAVIKTGEPATQKTDQGTLDKYETAPQLVVPPEVQPSVPPASPKSIEATIVEKVESETVKIQKTQDLERRWNEGVRLMEGGQYDKAIEAFTPMLDSEYSEKAQKKITEASLLAAEADRRKAADLFIRFTKASDVESRKKMLIESRQILQNILVKYPGVEITEKVLGNIKRVEKEMNTIDPTLIQQAGRVGGEERKVVEKQLQ